MTSPEPCARCGGHADFDIASLWLCVDCYHIAGSTCAGIGRVPATGAGSGATGAGSAAGVAGDVAGAVLTDVDQVC